jgi:hypothetical protein
MKKSANCLLRPDEDGWNCPKHCNPVNCRGYSFFDETPTLYRILGRVFVWLIMPLLALFAAIWWVVIPLWKWVIR